MNWIIWIGCALTNPLLSMGHSRTAPGVNPQYYDQNYDPNLRYQQQQQQQQQQVNNY